MSDSFQFSHPKEYRIVGVAGQGAYAIVTKADVIDEEFAVKIGMLESMSRQATSSGASGGATAGGSSTGMGAVDSDMLMDAAPAYVSPLQHLQRQTSDALVGAPLSEDPLVSRTESGRVVGSRTAEDAAAAAIAEDDETPAGSPLTGAAADTPPVRADSDMVPDAPLTQPPPQQQQAAGPSASPARSLGSVAIKQLLDFASTARAVDDSWRTHYLRKVCRELEILKHFSDVPQVINLCDAYMSRDHQDVYLVMPYVGRNLREVVLGTTTPLDEALIRWLMCQVLLGLRAIHTADVIHRDLSITNVLVETETWDAFIADFGLSRARDAADDEISLDVVTLPYRAPELLLEYTRYTDKIDIWSFGCLMGEAFIRNRPLFFLKPETNPDSFKMLKKVLSFTGFPDLDRVGSMASERNTNFLKNWAEKLGQAKLPAGTDIGQLLKNAGVASVSEDALDVLRAALKFDPEHRKSAAELLQMPWFQNDEDTRALIDMCDQQIAPPRKCPKLVESLQYGKLQEYIVALANGRTANIDSYVTQLFQ